MVSIFGSLLQTRQYMPWLMWLQKHTALYGQIKLVDVLAAVKLVPLFIAISKSYLP
jgi:hypothetical protein